MGLPKLDSPCSRCGWCYAGFHICFDASKPCPGEFVEQPTHNKTCKATPIADSRNTKATGPTNRWMAHRKENREKYIDVLEDYKAGAGLRSIAKQYGMGYQTIINVIRRAEEETGATIMRPVGVSNRNRKKVNDGLAS